MANVTGKSVALCRIAALVVGAFVALTSSIPTALAVDAATPAAVIRAETAAKDAGKLLDDGKLAEADTLVEAALAAALAELGERHPATLDLLDVKADLRQEQGQFEECVRMRVREVELRTQVNGAEAESTLISLSNLATALASAGRHAEGVAAFEYALAQQERVLGKEHDMIGNTVGDLASAQMRAGLTTAALRNYERGYILRLKAFGAEGVKTLIAMTNYGYGLTVVGRLEEAEPLSLRAWQLRRKVLGENHYDTATARNNYAAVLERLGRGEEASDHYRAASEAAAKALSPTHPSVLSLRSNYAVSLFRAGAPDRAMNELREILRQWETAAGKQHPKAVETRYHLASVLAAINDWTSALAEFETVLAARLTFTDPLHPEVLATRYAIAAAHAALGNRELAMTQLRDVIPQLQSGRLTTAALGAAAARSWQRSFSGTSAKLIELEIAAGNNAAAFNLLEQSKARVLIDQMGEQHAARNAGLPEADAQNLAALTETLSQLAAQSATMKRGLERDAVAAQSTRVAGELAELRASLAGSYPKFKQLTALDTATDLDGALLPNDTAFISYSVEPGGTIRAAILNSTGATVWHDLGTHPHIDRMAEALRLMASQPASARGIYEDDSGHKVRIVRWREGTVMRWRTVNDMRACTADEARADQRRSAGAVRSRHLLTSLMQVAPEPSCVPAGAHAISGQAHERDALAKALSTALLQPLAPSLIGKKRWLISPDAALWAVPWDLLPWQRAPLAASVEVTLTHSLSVHKIVRARLDRAMTGTDDRRDLLAFGDPIYRDAAASDTGRRSRRNPGQVALMRSPLRSSTDGESAGSLLRNINWPRLRYSRLEAELVAKHFPQTSVDLMLGEAASERQLRELDASGKLATYRHVLFSVHGFFDPTLPEHSSLVLVGDKGQNVDTRYDGMVSANELLPMRMGSDLTVLSACNTAMGKTVNSDGLVGLSYALLVAGNANTIATLWPVSDRETAHFVDRLFWHIKAGQPHGSALVMTKREFMQHKNPKLRDPRYWGAFVLFGA